MSDSDARWAQREEHDRQLAREEAARTPEERLASLKESGVFTASDGYPAIRMPRISDVQWAVAEVERLQTTTKRFIIRQQTKIENQKRAIHQLEDRLYRLKAKARESCGEDLVAVWLTEIGRERWAAAQEAAQRTP